MGKMILGLLMMLAVTFPTEHLKSEMDIAVSIQSAEDEIHPCADVIKIKYRNYNNRLQYRRWNETKGVWVDKNWIDVK